MKCSVNDLSAFTYNLHLDPDINYGTGLGTAVTVTKPVLSDFRSSQSLKKSKAI